MKIMTKIAGAGVVLIGLQGFAYGEEKQEKVLKFSRLKVSGSQDDAEIRAMEKPGSYSSKGEDTKLQSTDSILRSMPGTYTQIDPGQGTVTVNIRGLSGFGRVNMMVDGVSQSFYGTSPTSITHSNSLQSQFGSLIDPNFIVGVDISRGQSDGSDSVNALAGSANFRTIGVDDVIFSGNTLGIRTKMLYGDNGIGHNGMIAVAGKTQAFSSEGSIGAMLAVSGHSIDANYKNADGISSDEFGTDKSFKQKPNSQLMKLNIKPNEFHDMELSGRLYHNKFTQRHIDSEDFYLKYNYKPFSELVDMKLLVSTSGSDQIYNSALNALTNSKTKNKSNAINLNNISRFNYGDTDFELIFGGKLMKTEYSKTTDSVYSDIEDEEKKKKYEKTDSEAKENNSFAPSGKQDIASIYSGLKINRDIYQVNINLNYMDYSVKGHKPACELRVNCFPQGESKLNLKERGFNPSILLSAEIIPEFQPFVSYTHSMRAPNAQEVFYGNEGGASINPFLKGEKSDTYQIGFNSYRPDMIVKGDTFRLKAAWYHTKIKNYISSDSYTLCKDGRICQYSKLSEEDWKHVDANFGMYIYSNSITPVIMRGYEVSADYDAGVFYSKLAYSRQKTSQPTSISTSIFGADPTSELPESFLTLDTGGRLLGEKLRIGTIIKYTGNSYKLDSDPYNQDSDGRTVMEKERKIPIVVDFYGDYKINKNVLFKFSVQNLTNRNYSEALNRMSNTAALMDKSTSAMQTARGRTYIVGAEIRF
ncbi:TonB-dependent receptor domain-containing protein [Photorhabdus antumapuensis]|uniref:TonB-dependent receptor domain-containing protein n=1 Tax=Photorhabdus antumapuensis TaxID=2862867 RepID=UPI001CED94F8|nr:TonB-dependent receptor [Photorhabdus antumapuensis]MCA6219453.1 TonB-dependent receptor [Photorhabdus antumapuensis]